LKEVLAPEETVSVGRKAFVATADEAGWTNGVPRRAPDLRLGRYSPDNCEFTCSGRCMPECNGDLVDLVDHIASSIEAHDVCTLVRVCDEITDLIGFCTEIVSSRRSSWSMRLSKRRHRVGPVKSPIG
jgi:hypothetical protein